MGEAGIDRRVLDEVMEGVLRVSRRLFEEGLVKSTFGVVSARIPGTDYVVITPSGFRKERVARENLVVVDLDGRVVQGRLRPSSETPMHVYVHRNIREAACVVHTHSPMATVFAIIERDIPCVSSEQAFTFGGRIPVVRRYSFPGTTKVEELEAIVEALRACRVALLKRHGVIAYGEDFDEALDNAVVVEDIATSAILALLLGRPKEFTEEEIEAIQEFKRTRYGQRPSK
ncbi:MAG TPA: class II aldolase/adducin family protein [Nitrososphaeria archaeon]|nr:class II aldolase/adducin family protein [Nitrososphaeria archaeon]